ncbi:hypothetical protein [Staphylococcus phage vB_SsapH-Golestan-100]|nr:hypothetical protein [Staphylococcus phage vB_SsapH-Golestan-100]
MWLFFALYFASSLWYIFLLEHSTKRLSHNLYYCNGIDKCYSAISVIVLICLLILNLLGLATRSLPITFITVIATTLSLINYIITYFKEKST